MEKNTEEIKQEDKQEQKTNEIDIEAIQNQTLRGNVVVKPEDKKSKLKKISLSIILSLVFVVGAIVGFYFICAPKAKTFECMDMKITLTSKFDESENINYLKTYKSNDMIVTITRETIEELSSISDIDENSTESAYLQLIIELNDLLSTVKKEDGLVYADYYKTVSSNDYFYRAYVFKNDGAFWMIQMACFNKNQKDLIPEMQKYAKSVTFGI